MSGQLKPAVAKISIKIGLLSPIFATRIILPVLMRRFCRNLSGCPDRDRTGQYPSDVGRGIFAVARGSIA